MRLQNSGSVTQVEFERRLVLRIFKIKEALGLSTDSLAELLEIKPSKCTPFELRKLDNRNLDAFCKKLELNVNLLFEDKVDYLGLAKTYCGNDLALPERYLNASHKRARLRVVKSTFELLRSYFGSDYAKRVLARLQIKPIFLEQAPSTFISWRIIEDFLKELRKAGFAEDHFKQAGLMNVCIDASTEFGRFLQSIPMPSMIYPAVLGLDTAPKFYDRIFQYRPLRVTEDDTILEVSAREESFDVFGPKGLGTRTTCLYRQGVMASYFYHRGTPHVTVTERECMYLGDKRCVYHIAWNREATSRVADHPAPALSH